MEAPPGERIDWHTAFCGALRLSFEGYEDTLRFVFEHRLTAEPLRIDALIEKAPGAVVDTELGRLFRRWNLVEYKGPADSLTIGDFRKVRAYTELYGSQNNLDSPDMTISFVVSRYPRDLIKRLEGVYEYQVQKAYAGIYYIRGYEIPIQIVVTSRLHEGAWLWLKHLSNRVTAEGLGRVMAASRTKPKEYTKAYIQMLCQANPEILREVMEMRKTTVKQILEEAGWTAEWEARGEMRGRLEGEMRGRLEGEMRGRLEGEMRGRLEVAKNLISLGLSIEQISKAAELDMDKVRDLCFDT